MEVGLKGLLQLGRDRGHFSNQMVTGPSFWRSTSMWAPKDPVWVGTPWEARRAVKRSTRGAATSGGAASEKEGRRPLRASPYRVNCETTRADPPTSSRDRLNLPAESSKMRSVAIFSARKRAWSSLSWRPMPSRMTRPAPISATSLPSTLTFAPWTRCSRARISDRPALGQLYRRPHFSHCPFGDFPGPVCPLVQHGLDALRLRGQFGPFFPERFQGFVQVPRKDLLAVHTADAGPPAFEVDALHLWSRGEGLMHGEHIADVRVARVSPLDARRVGDHHHDARLSFLRRGGQLDLVVQALAHLLLTVNAEHFWDLGRFHAWFDQDIRVVAVVERADGFAGELKMRRLVDANRHQVGFIKGDVGRHEDRIADQGIVDV